MLRPIIVTGEAPFLREPCALCQERFVEGDTVVRCPVDRATHHVACWQANHNECVALGCNGSGRVVGQARPYNSQNQLEREEEPIQLIEGEILDAAEAAHHERVEHFYSTKRLVRLPTCLFWAVVSLLFSCALICGSAYFAGSLVFEGATEFMNSVQATAVP